MKSTLLTGLAPLGVALALFGAAPAAADDAPAGLEKREGLPLGLQGGPAAPGPQGSEAQSVIKDEASEVPNTGGVTAGDETEVGAQIEGRGTASDPQQAASPDGRDEPEAAEPATPPAAATDR